MVKRKNTELETIAYKFRAYPDEYQKVILARTFGCCRYLWNRMLSDREALYKEIGSTPDNTPADYKYLDECLWLSEVDSMALDSVRVDQKQAYESFFRGNSRHPVFKCKNKRQSYRTNMTNGNIKLFKNGIKLPKIDTVLKIKQHRKIRKGGKLKSVTVSLERNGTYYVSILFEYPLHTFTKEHTHQNCPVSIGLDMKLQHLYVDNNGISNDMPQYYRKNEELLAIKQTKLSHMTKGSNNYKRQRRRLAKLYAKIKHQRLDYLRKEAKRLAETYDVICIEDLDLKSMANEHGKSVNDNAFGLFVLWLNRECQKSGSVVIKVDRYYASTQICHHCGSKQIMPVHMRIYECPNCHISIDRDENSALNILTEGLRIYRLTA